MEFSIRTTWQECRLCLRGSVLGKLLKVSVSASANRTCNINNNLSVSLDMSYYPPRAYVALGTE